LGREREVRAALAVWERAPVDALSAELLDDGVELLREARLPDPCWAEDGDEVRHLRVRDALPGAAQHLELARPADERARQAPLACRVQRPHRDPRLDGRLFPLRLDRFGRLVLDYTLRGRVGLRADDHPVHRGRAL